MSHTLPIALVLYTSSKGHWGHRDVYKATVNHWAKQVPLDLWGARIAHIKVGTTHEDAAVAGEMETWLIGRGFKVIKTVADWSRGMSHQSAYMTDCVTMSTHPDVLGQPYYLHVEDDSPMVSHVDGLADLWLRAAAMLAADPEMLTARVMRRGDEKGPTVDAKQPDTRYFWSEHVNFQPLLMRSLDFYRLGILLQANPQACQQVQCEMLWRVILSGFSRSPFKHLVWEVDHAETLHIGVEAYPQLVQQHDLVTV